MRRRPRSDIETASEPIERFRSSLLTEANRAADQSLKPVLELFQGGMLSQREVTATKADFMRAEADLKRSSARIALYGNPSPSVYQEFPLPSPVDGAVVDRDISPEQELYVGAQTDKLLPASCGWRNIEFCDRDA